MHKDIRSFLTPIVCIGLPVLGLLCLGLAAIPVLAFESPSSEHLAANAASFTMMPGVVVDPTAKVVYAMGAEGGVEALALGDGRLLWSSKEAARPLILFGDYLIAQREAANRGIFELVFLAVDGGAVSLPTSVALAAEVDALVDDGLGREFRVNARLEFGVPVIHWSYDTRRITGAHPSLVPDADETQRFSGRLRFDVSTEAWNAEAGAAGGVVAPRPDLASEDRLPDVEGTQFRSADGGHVMSSQAVADHRVFDRYRWSIRSREDGNARGEVRSFVSWAPHFVADTVLVRESPTHQVRVGDELTSQPRRLVASDLRNGRQLWARPVRDTAYRGPFPP